MSVVTNSVFQALPDSNQDSVFWSERCVLITGCSGFIGGILAEALLASGATVVGMLRDPAKDCYLTRSEIDKNKRFTSASGDLRDEQYVDDVFSKHPVDAVFHLAGEAILGKDGGSDAYSQNRTVTQNLLLALKAHRQSASFLQASTDMVYGPGSARPFDESMEPQPHNPYAQSKRDSEMLVARHVEHEDLVAGIVRLSNVYGGGDTNLSRLIPGIVCQILAGEAPVLRSDGQSVRDFVHVIDVVHALMTLSNELSRGNQNGEIYNIASGQSVRVLDLVNEMLKAAACEDREPILGVPDSQADAQRHVSINKAHSCLGWEPQISLSRGIAMTINWYENAGFVSKEGV